MPDAVWPAAQPRPTSSRNGFGRELRGFTRPDESGRRFATCWVVAFGLPIVPLSRCYLRERSGFPAGRGFRTRSGRYEIYGQSRRRLPEIVRTYLFCWLVVPVVVIAPVLVLLSQAERIAGDDASAGAKLALVGAFLVLLVGSVLVVSALLALYQTRFAPVRSAVWVDPPAVRRSGDA